MNKISLKKVQEKLSIGRSTLYRHIKKHNIETVKIKRVSYLSLEDFGTLQRETQREKEETETTNNKAENETVPLGDSGTELGHIEKIYKEQVAELKAELQKEREKHKAELETEQAEKLKIAYQLGQAQSEHSHTKQELLRLQQINEAPEELEPIKKSWWQVWK